MPRADRSIRQRRGGFTLVDVCVALFVLAIALGTLVGTVFSALRLADVDEETAAASQALRSALEQMSALTFADIYAAYDRSPKDDPDPEHDYLADLVVSDPVLSVGRKTKPTIQVLFPGDENGELREDAKDEALGLPRDLNGDGAIDARNHAADYVLLPVRLRMQWDGASGTRALELSTLLRAR